ncbi:mediator of RNA polymerase II transcription subunit 13 [Xylographa opegraphella]|nr:mediator of RNA polymerase II transcription subunit 13 [Xylographa opegraphella]
MSIWYLLADTDYYIPLSPNEFLCPRPEEDHILGLYTNWRDSSDLFNTFCLEVQWLPCGTLLIYSYPEPGVLRHNLVEEHLAPDRSPDFEFQLAPFGTVATQYDESLRDNGGVEVVEQMEDIIESNEESRLQNLKPSISWLLEQHGLRLSEHCEWLRVNIKSSANDLSRKRNGALPSGTILWPAHLCFYEDNQFTSGMNTPSWLWPGLETPALDPLKAAETWFLEKDSREKAIEQKRAEVEAQSRLERQDIPLDDDDLLPTGFLTIDRHMNVQGANGIYPTPPDGPLGQGSDRGPYDQANIHSDTEMLDLVEDQGTVLEQIDQQRGLNTETGMSLGAYKDTEEDDLFGDMDSAMFTAKGITEDDFDFFDEPEDLSGYVPSTFDPDPLTKGGADHTASHASNPTESSNVDMTVDETYDTGGLGRISMMQTTPAEDKIHVKTEDSSNQSQSQPPLQSIKDDLKQYIMPMPVGDSTSSFYITSQSEQASEDQHSVFGSIPLWDVSRNLDQKYRDRGRFSVGIGIRENDLDRKQQRVEKFVPLLGQLTGISDDGLDSDEDYRTSGPHTPKSSTNHDDYEAITDITKIYLPQTPLSPEGIDTECKTVPAPPQMLPGSNSIPHNSSLQTNPSSLTRQVYRGHDGKFIQVAQILADQLLAYSKADTHDEFFPILGTINVYAGVPFEDPLRNILDEMFPRDEICTLEACAGLSDGPRGAVTLPKVVVRPTPKKQDSVRGPSQIAGYPSITCLASPDLRVLRGDTLMDISSTALQFWEELGLSPCMGPKDVISFCVYPHTEMVRRGTASFMNLVSSVFQSLRLGACSCGSEILDEFPIGLVPVSLNTYDIESAMKEIDIVCEYLGMPHHRH